MTKNGGLEILAAACVAARGDYYAAYSTANAAAKAALADYCAAEAAANAAYESACAAWNRGETK